MVCKLLTFTAKKIGEYERSLIVVFSDHGEEFWEHALLEKQYYQDYRGFWGVGHGHALFREILHVPFLIKGLYPNRPKRITQPVGIIDLNPTILDELDLNIPNHLVGRSLRPLLDGRTLPQIPQIAENIFYGPPKYSIIHNGWHFIDAPFEIDIYFNLSNDPEECTPIFQPSIEGENSFAQILQQFLRKHHNKEAPTTGISLKQLDKKTRERLKAIGYYGEN